MGASESWSRRSEETRFQPPRAKLLLLALTSALFAAVGFLASRADYSLLSGLGWIMLVGLGAGTVVMLARALRPGPTVVVDRDGIHDRTGLVPTGLVRWDDISVLRKREIGRGMGRERTLEVVLSDTAAFHTRPRSAARRFTDAYRRVVKQPAVNIPGSMVAAPMDQVARQIADWKPGLQLLDLPPKPQRRRFTSHDKGLRGGKPNPR